MAVVLTVAWANALSAQAIITAPLPASDDSAKAVVEVALTALGGPDFLGGIPGVRLHVVGTRRWDGQGPSPANPADFQSLIIDEVLVAGVGVYQRYEQRADGETNWCVETWASTTEGYQYDCLSRVLRPIPGPQRVVTAWARQRQVHGQIAALLSPGVTISYVGTVDSAGRTLRRLRETAPPGPEIVWSFDAVTGLPFSRASMLTTTLGDSTQALTSWEDYRRVGSVIIPFLTRNSRPGDLSDERRIASIEPARVMPPSRRARGLRESDSLGRTPTTVVELGPGAILIEDVVPTYNSLVADVGDGLAVVEAPGGDGPSASALKLVAERFPGRTVRYLVLTHFHHDHIAGAAEYVRRGATILTTEGNVRWLEDLMQRRLAGSVSGRQTPVVQAVSDGRTLGRDNGRMVLRVIDARPHVDQMILAYLPGSQTLFVTDMFFLEPTGQVRPASRERVRFAATLEALQLDVARIAGGHGGLATPADIRASLDQRHNGRALVDPPLEPGP